jgi:hypothetical protein
MKNDRERLESTYTVFTGTYHAVVGTALSPDDPEFKRRERRGPNAPKARASKKRNGKKPNK